ncbi:MAG: matrixin family metalloprotease [Myxococcota bacterium]
MLTLLASTAFAYDLLGFDWAWQDAPLEYPIVLDADSFPADFADPDELEENIVQATEAWSDTRAGFGIEYGGRQATLNAPSIRVYFVENSDGPLLGAANTFAYGGDIQSCEIQVYRSNASLVPIPWSFAPDAADLPFEQFDFQSVLLHELGHCFGLNHSDAPDALMRPELVNGTASRTVSDDDEDGLIAMYGKAGCATVPAAPGFALLLVPLFTFRRRS